MKHLLTLLTLALAAPLSVGQTATTLNAGNKHAANKHASKVITVLEAPDATAKERSFEDKRFGVSFRIPPGWDFSRKDGEVSTFHQDARSASRTAELRGVAILNFNPFPRSTLAGALFYYSVEPKTTDVACAAQASSPVAEAEAHHKDVQAIGGVPFAHGHDEHGEICTEARDEVYTAFHNHTCYRFDLAMNTFCGVSSGAQEITDAQIHQIDERLVGILSTVTFTWEPAGSNPVPVPELPASPSSNQPAQTVPGVL